MSKKILIFLALVSLIIFGFLIETPTSTGDPDPTWASDDLESGTISCDATVVGTNVQTDTTYSNIDLDFDPATVTISEIRCKVNFTSVNDSASNWTEDSGYGEPWLSCDWNAQFMGRQENISSTGEKTISTTSSTVIDTTTQTGNTLVTHLYCGDSEDACNPQGDTLEYQDVWVEISYIINPPTVTTSAATGVTSSQATLNGNITDTGGVTVDERGFEWDIDSGEPYANSWTEIGSFGTGAFNHTITGLSINTTYYFRAKVRNSVGWGYGSEGSFTTTLLSGGFAGSTGTFTLTTLGTNYVRYYSVDLAGNEEAIGSQQVNIAANTPPEARNLFADTDNPVFCCGVTGYPPVRLGWEFFDPDGDNQSAYQIQVDDDPNFLSPEVDSGQVSSPSTEYAPTTLSFATTYYWQVEVWDDKTTPVSSGWVNGPSFTTISHPFPLVDFDWSPQYPTREEVVQFCSVYEEVTIPCGEPPCPIEVICPADVSTCYSGIGNTNPISCSGGTFLWEIIPPEGGTFVSPTTSVSLNPRIKFLSSDVRLSVTDADNYGPCSITQPITIALPLPEWKEIAPF